MSSRKPSAAHEAPAAAPAAAPLAPPAPATTSTAIPRFAIEDNIPFPTRRAPGSGESAYPYAKLNVGQSFFVPASDKMKEPWKTLTSLSSRMSRDLHPKRFTTGRETRDGVDGVRIWRNEDATGPLKPKRSRRPKAPRRLRPRRRRAPRRRLRRPRNARSLRRQGTATPLAGAAV